MAAKKEASSLPAYVVVTPVIHDGARYEVGELIELPAESASQLLEFGSIQEAEHGD